MKWIGQHIWDFISRFRSDVYLEATETGTIASGGNLGLDSNNKVVKATGVSSASTVTVTDSNSLLYNPVVFHDGSNGLLDDTGSFEYSPYFSTLRMQSSSLAFNLINTADDANDPHMSFTNTRGGSAGQNDDTLGMISFYGKNNAGSPETISYSSFTAYIADVTDGSEAGKVTLNVATDGSQQQALLAVGDAASSKVDIGLGYGAASTTTIAGDLQVSGGNIIGTTDSDIQIDSDNDIILNVDNDNDSTNNTVVFKDNGTTGFTYNVSRAAMDMVSSVSGYPLVEMNSTSDDANAAVFTFKKSRTDSSIQVGETSDALGKIEWKGYNDGTPALKSFAQIVSTIADPVTGAEAGDLTIKVASFDGVLTDGLKLHGDTNADGEVDVTIGSGTASTTTIAGTLTMGSTAAMTNAGLLSVANQSNITGLGTITSGTWTGTAIADTYVANDLTISGGTVNNSVIGGSTPAAITGTTIDANTDFTVGTTVITDDQIQFTPSTSDTATISAGSNGSLNITTADASGSNATIEIVGDGTINTTSSVHRITKTYDFHSTTFENNMIAGKPDGIVVKYEPNGDSSPNICQVYYLRTNGAWLQADADQTATSTGLLAVGTGSSSQTIGLMIRGFMRIPYTEILNVPGSGAVDGLPVYLGTEAGHFDFTAPSASGDIVRILGYAIDDHDDGSGNVDVLVYFDPDKSWIEIA